MKILFSFLLLVLAWDTLGPVTPQDATFSGDKSSLARKATGAADRYASIQVSHDGLPSSGGQIYIPAGTHFLTSQVHVSKPVRIRGAGMNTTIIKPIALSGRVFDYLFSSGDANGWELQDLTIDMTNVPAQEAVRFFGLSHILMSNVRIVFPNSAASTGTAVEIASTAGAYLDNVIIQNPGIGLLLQG